ncbi:MAG TPA: quinone oxidoreductase [Polyangiaceae bacterium]
MTTRAVRFAKAGGPEVLEFDLVELEPPQPREVTVRHTAIGVNFIDVYHRSGLYPVARLPSGIGVEGAGVIEATGHEASEWNIGDRVAYVGGSLGAYAERRNIAADKLVRLPEGVSEKDAAAIMLKGMTVEFLIRRAYTVQPGQTVLWHAAAGGVGLIACQWLRSLGVNVIGTVGSPAKAELARKYGCQHTILYQEENFPARVRELTNGKGVPVVYDAVGKSTFTGSLDCLSPRGMLVEFGNASGKPDPFDVSILANKGSLFLTRPTLFSYLADAEELRMSANALFDVVQSGAVRPQIGQQLALSAAQEAHRQLEARETTGSIVLVP